MTKKDLRHILKKEVKECKSYDEMIDKFVNFIAINFKMKKNIIQKGKPK